MPSHGRHSRFSPDRPNVLPRRAIALAVTLTCAGLAWAPPGLIRHAQAQQSQAPHRFDIPAGPLNTALNRFAEEAGVFLSGASELTQGKTTRGVNGALSNDAAIGALLAGTGLEAVKNSQGHYVLRESAPTQGAALPTVQVTGNTDNAAITENSGSYAAIGATTAATGMAMSLRETPQSVSVVTQQQMRDRHMQSLDDVADAATGITYSKVGTQRSTFYSRGFTVTDLQFDGMASSVAESYSLDVMSLNNMAIYDRVEFVRGATGLMQGAGNPSASINMVRKRPTREFQFSAELSRGSWNDKRAQVDVGGPLNEAGTLRGRAVAFTEEADGFKTGAGTRNSLLYGILEADLSPSTLLTLGASVQTDNHRGYEWGGLVTRSDGSFYNLDRSTSLAGPWAHLNRNNKTLFGDLSHRFDNDWKVTGAFNVVESDSDFLASYPARTTGDNYRLVVSNALYKDKQYAFNLNLSGPFELFGRKHELMLGATSRKDDFKYTIYTATNTPTVNITSFDFWSIPAPTLNYASPSYYAMNRTEKGLYAATRLHATDALSVILGTRFSWAEYGVKSPYVNQVYNSGKQTIPYAGVVYELNDQHALYASYTDIYRIQDYYGPNGLLKPLKGRNYETGLKSQFLGGRLHTSVALFQTDQVNLPESLGTTPTCGVSGTSNCYTEGGTVRNRGFELEVTGALSQAWNVAAGYTYSNPGYVAGASKGKPYNTTVPRRVLKLATDYKLTPQWRIGGDLQAQSEGFYSGSTFSIRQGGYGLLNLHASYRYDQHWSAQLNIRNALDKNYYASIPTNNNFGYVVFGDPRSFMATLRYDY